MTAAKDMRTNKRNIPWLSGLPPGWAVLPSKRLFRLRNERARAGDEQLTASQDHGVIRQADFMALAGRAVVRVELNPEILKHVEQGDFVISMRSFQGGLEHAKASGCISSAYVVLEPSPQVDRAFFGYLFKSARYISALQATSNLVRDGQALRYDNFSQVDLPVPPRDQQRAIANFLGEKTAAIDVLIEKRQRLIALLEERRQAIITSAVTGLWDSAAARTKLRSVWFPSMPTDWKHIRLKHVVWKVADGPHFSPPYVEPGAGAFMFLSARNVKVDGWSFEDAKYIDSDLYREFSRRIIPERGDVLYTKGGTTGVARAVDFDEPFQVWVHIAVLKVRKQRCHPSFLAYALNSTPCYAQSQLYTRGATNKDLGLTRMVNIELLLPDLETQMKIVSWLDDATGRIAAALNAARRSIAALVEHRQTLTTAAVTGQVTVAAPSAL